jgi:two-component system response regulator HupR/HoxA
LVAVDPRLLELPEVRAVVAHVHRRFGASLTLVDSATAAAPDEQRVSLTPATSLAARPAAPVSPGDRAILDELLTVAASELGPIVSAPVTPAAGPRARYDALVGASPAMQALYAILDRVVVTDATVLITGENGTGKELIARAVHAHSARADRRFVVQNCAAFSDSLLDSELFGHKRGAFTGAIADKRGLFEVADGGTFFLDEIGDTSPALQVKLLRVLQEGTFTPVGDTTMRTVDVRVVAATNRDLPAMVARGDFREDLFYRLNVISVTAPPLRQRLDDLPILAEHFLRKHSRGRGRVKRLHPDCWPLLRAYPWPGNVRELENEMERLMVLAGTELVIPPSLLAPRIRAPMTSDVQGPRTLPEAVAALERDWIQASLTSHAGNKTRVAQALGISRRNLIRLVKRYDLDGARPGRKKPGR